MEALFDQVESPVLRKLFKFLTSETVSKELEDFLDEHCDDFSGQLEDIVGEQDLSRYDTYKDYCGLLDRQLARFCKKNEVSQTEIRDECENAILLSKKEPNMTSLLLDMLLSATDYQMFCVNMSSFKRYKDTKEAFASDEGKTCEDDEQDSEDEEAPEEIEEKSNFESKFEDRRSNKK